MHWLDLRLFLSSLLSRNESEPNSVKTKCEINVHECDRKRKQKISSGNEPQKNMQILKHTRIIDRKYAYFTSYNVVGTKHGLVSLEHARTSHVPELPNALIRTKISQYGRLLVVYRLLVMKFAWQIRMGCWIRFSKHIYSYAIFASLQQIFSGNFHSEKRNHRRNLHLFEIEPQNMTFGQLWYLKDRIQMQYCSTCSRKSFWI